VIVKKTLESDLFSPEDAPYPEDMARLFTRFMTPKSRCLREKAPTFGRASSQPPPRCFQTARFLSDFPGKPMGDKLSLSLERHQALLLSL
jgi:hypothetical protein